MDTPDHAAHHTIEDDTLEAIQAKVGIDSSAVTTTHDYKLSTITGSGKVIPLARTIATTTPLAGGGDLSANRTLTVSAATSSATGVSELAIASEVTTGTDTTRAVTADALAGSDYGKRVVGLAVTAAATSIATGDGQAFFRVPSVMNGWNLVGVAASVFTAGTTNTTDVQVRNVTDSVDILSTVITIDSTEVDTSTAATPAVINTSNDDVATGDRIAIDVDATHTTPAKGLYVELVFQLP